jgi:hypothetical protein
MSGIGAINGGEGPMDGNQRDYIGYADRLPEIAWPGGNRVAVSLVLNYEEGSERSVDAGDPAGRELGRTWQLFYKSAEWA